MDCHAGSADAELPFADGQFDAAFLAEVIGEVPDKDACLRSLARIVKPGGVLVFHESFPDPDRLTLPELRARAEPHGFELAICPWQPVEGRRRLSQTHCVDWHHGGVDVGRRR